MVSVVSCRIHKAGEFIAHSRVVRVNEGKRSSNWVIISSEEIEEGAEESEMRCGKREFSGVTNSWW